MNNDTPRTKPVFSLNDGFNLNLWRKSDIDAISTTHDTTHDSLDFMHKSDRLVLVVSGEMNRGELMEKLKISNRVYFAKNYLKPVLESGYLEKTIPDKPQSKNQQYKLTRKGKVLQRKLKKRINQ